jgi:hypothetical protein
VYIAVLTILSVYNVMHNLYVLYLHTITYCITVGVALGVVPRLCEYFGLYCIVVYWIVGQSNFLSDSAMQLCDILFMILSCTVLQLVCSVPNYVKLVS